MFQTQPNQQRTMFDEMAINKTVQKKMEGAGASDLLRKGTFW